jgi:DNA-binding NtrC family response regulator
MRHIAIIEDESDIAGLLAHGFACEGFEVSTAGDGVVGLDVVRRVRPDLRVPGPAGAHGRGCPLSDSDATAR